MTADQAEKLREKTSELVEWERKFVLAKTQADFCQAHMNQLELEIQQLMHDEPKMPVVEIPEASLAEEGAPLN
jgi:hypothetical protein